MKSLQDTIRCVEFGGCEIVTDIEKYITQVFHSADAIECK